MSSALALTPALIRQLKQALVKTDEVAYYNVTHDDQGASILDSNGSPIKGKFSRGGPFGALLGISLEDGSFEVVGTPRGNNVVGSGIASRHAEDQALQPDNYKILTSRLSQLNAVGHTPTAWMISSGQSCTNCHTKQEIMARDLAAQGLINPGRFVTLYGATYDDTFKIAQFYDAQYADALILSSLIPENPENLIRQDRIAYQAAPFAVQQILSSATVPTAVVMRNNEVYAVGTENRSPFDPYATAEVNAVRAACLRNREEGEFASWTVDGEIYTTNREIDPLFFAEAGWTKIGLVKSVTMPDDLAHRAFITRATPALDNTAFLKIVAGGYHNPDAAIQVLRDEGFKNTAQPKWAEMLAVNNEQLYNGAAVSPNVELMRRYTRTRFAAAHIDNFSTGRNVSQRPIKYLNEIEAPSRDVG